MADLPTRDEERRQPVEGDTRPSAFSLWALLGGVGSILLAIASDLPGSPYGPGAGRGLWPFKLSGSAPAWEGPKVPLWAMVSNQSGTVARAHLLTTLMVVVGISLLCLAWALVWRAAHAHPKHKAGKLWWVVGAWTAPLLFAAPFATDDVWTYGAEGHLVLVGTGGYRTASLLHSVWGLAVGGRVVHPSPYGPGALDLSAVFVKISGGHPWVAAECWRISAIAGLLLCAWGVTHIVSLRGGNATAAVIAGVANPAFLIILVGGPHNDALMLGLMVAGVALALAGRRSWGMALCVLAMAVKPNALLAVGAVAWWAWGSSWRQRLKGVTVAATTVVGVLFVCGLAVGGGFGWLKANSLGAVSDPPWGLAPKFLGLESRGPIVDIELAGLALAVALVIVIGRSGRWVTALGWAFAVVALTIPKPEPWYLTWSVALLVCGGLHRRTERAGVLILVGMMVGTLLPVAYVWWLGGVVLLVWLAATSVWDRLDASEPAGGQAPRAPDPEGSEEARALALSRPSPDS